MVIGPCSFSFLFYIIHVYSKYVRRFMAEILPIRLKSLCNQSITVNIQLFYNSDEMEYFCINVRSDQSSI